MLWMTWLKQSMNPLLGSERQGRNLGHKAYEENEHYDDLGKINKTF